MIAAVNVSLRFGKRILFEDVNVRFTAGNCYGVIGANGAGKSTFLKILSGEIDPTTGKVEIDKGARMSVLKQNHYEFDDLPVLETVLMGHTELYSIMKEKEEIYAKTDFTDADGERVGELEAQFAEMNGWDAESDAAALLSNLGISESTHYKLLKELDGNQKVRVLLAQALFNAPDILLLDEPTNDLDVETIGWLEDFLADYDKCVLVVSHDRHFLDSVCTHVADIDFSKIQTFSGNYTFWYESSQLAARQQSDQRKKSEERVKELQEFIRRFAANVSKSRQATARKKALDKIDLSEIKPSNRKYPGIVFNQMVREAGDQVLEVSRLTKKLGDDILFENVDFHVNAGDKIALISRNSLATSAFYSIVNGEDLDFTGEYRYGQTITKAYMPIENHHYFKSDLNLIDWLRQYSTDKDETYVRGFLGRMLFSGEESLKQCNVLSGGEKMRCMFSRMMLQNANFLMFDEPTNHLDLESITSLNNGMKDYRSMMIFTCRDHELTETVANRIIELTPSGYIDRLMSFDDYISDPRIKEMRQDMYKSLSV
ncbi:MAG: ABC-F family ATP-binding cassette domain-containing protein [Saprospiraceae bacterium]